ncbi:glycosyltransferase [Streptomyces sp. RKAG293]|uniref:glycosyltransferase n=1 Tax=Streptomyces sp. RKAG293 TaxID=2893403 RepID=UPI00203329F9|nr:glycosyltransferase [Streptomyces sp. RKAG293]MCM2422757.1 glycosyltransferase [Streptomyces sp. RKAG293]
MKVTAIGVVVPAHNEQVLLPRALNALEVARRHPALAGVRIVTVVAADSCRDDTAALARRAGAEVVELSGRSPGAARAAGVAHALAVLRTPAAETWIATTDADSAVPPDWLARQAEYAGAGWEAVVGTVRVENWPPHAAGVAARFEELYEASRPAAGLHWEHPHVHGANLGVAAGTYLRIGGFPPLTVGEDRGLVAALERGAHRVLRTADCAVVTSARLRARARGGFGDYLIGLTRSAEAEAEAGTAG